MPGIDEVVHVPVHLADSFRGKIAAINRRARGLRLGLEIALGEEGVAPRPVTVTRLVFAEGGQHRETVTRTMDCQLFRLSCPEPVIALPGWRYAGYVAGKNAKRDVGSGEVAAGNYWLPSEDHQVPQRVLDHAFNADGLMRCDHCNTFRSRRVGILVVNEAGAVRVVGSSCCRDYLGHDPKALLRHYQHINALAAEVARERRDGWYRLTEYDREAEERARAAERERCADRDARAYPLRAIVGATLQATLEQDGLVLTRQGYGSPLIATWELAAERLLEGGPDLSPAQWGMVDAAIAWFRRARDHRWRRWEHGVLEGADRGRDVVVADAQRTMWMRDIMVAWAAAAGVPLRGRFFQDGDVVRVRHVRSWDDHEERAQGDYDERTPVTRHLFRAEDGSLIRRTLRRGTEAPVRRGQWQHLLLKVRAHKLEGLDPVTVASAITLLEEDEEGRPLLGGQALETVDERDARLAREAAEKAARKAARAARRAAKASA